MTRHHVVDHARSSAPDQTSRQATTAARSGWSGTARNIPGTGTVQAIAYVVCASLTDT
jgi:hypothetical protein